MKKVFGKKYQFENCFFLTVNDHIESPCSIPNCSPKQALSGTHKGVQEMMQPMNFFTSVAFIFLIPTHSIRDRRVQPGLTIIPVISQCIYRQQWVIKKNFQDKAEKIILAVLGAAGAGSHG
jgi:hypothetical protein